MTHRHAIRKTVHRIRGIYRKGNEPGSAPIVESTGVLGYCWTPDCPAAFIVHDEIYQFPKDATELEIEETH